MIWKSRSFGKGSAPSKLQVSLLCIVPYVELIRKPACRADGFDMEPLVKVENHESAQRIAIEPSGLISGWPKAIRECLLAFA